MRAFIVAFIVFGLTCGISILVLFRYGLSDNQSLPPSTAVQKTFTFRNGGRIRYRRIALAAAAARMVMRWHDPHLSAIDDWRAKHDIAARPEAIRRLVELGLKAKGK
jgi:hypothetical protein